VNGARLSGISQRGGASCSKVSGFPPDLGGSGDPQVGYPQARRRAAQVPHARLSQPAPQTRDRADFVRFTRYVHNVLVPAGEDVLFDLPARGRGVSEEAS